MHAEESHNAIRPEWSRVSWLDVHWTISARLVPSVIILDRGYSPNKIADFVLDRSPRSNVISVSCPTVANAARYESAQSLVAGCRSRVRARSGSRSPPARRQIPREDL